MAKTLGNVMNAALYSIGEPPITSIDTTNILQLSLIAEANNAVRDILGRYPFEWGLKRTTLITVDDVTTDTVSVTNGSATVTSSGNNFTNVTTSMYFRVTGDTTSYAISTVTTSSSPDTLTLETTYKGTTNTSASYRCLQDTYAMTDADLDEVRLVGYGDAASWVASINGSVPNNQISLVKLSDIYRAAGGDLHRNTAGRPTMMARISVNSSDYPRFVLWPFPDDDYLIEVWYSILYGENSTFSTSMFAADAPQVAYDAVEHRVRYRAYVWDKRMEEADQELKWYQIAVANLLRRENALEKDHSITVETFSRTTVGGFPARSSLYFDLKSARR